MRKNDAFASHREAIDRLDGEILELLSARAAQVEEIGKLKHQNGGSIRVPEREHRLLSRLKQLNRGPYSDAAIEAIYREIISASLALEAPLSVAYLGPPGTFSHQAAVTAFGHSVDLHAQPEFCQIFEEVEKGEASYGVVPIENSVEGMVYQSLDLLMSHRVGICAELYMPVHHSFLTAAKDLSKIKTIYSHAQAWGQCSLWLESHGFDHRYFEEVTSTAKAALLASKSPKRSAAIASLEAGLVYDLPVFREGIQDSVGNETRFAVIGLDKPEPTGYDKTTIVFQAEDRIGFLAGVLRELADAGINLTKIESRPSRVKDWDYIFYIEMEGHIVDTRVSETLARLEKQCPFFCHLGSYPYYRIPAELHRERRPMLVLSNKAKP